MPHPTRATRTAYSLLAALGALAAHSPPASAQAQRTEFRIGERYLVLEALDDDLIHFEMASGRPGTSTLATSVMVLKTDYTGADTYAVTDSVVETAMLRLVVEPATLCVRITDRVRDAELTTLCPSGAAPSGNGLTIRRGGAEHVYGLGEQFTVAGEANGDWLGRARVPGNEHGNRMVGFSGGAVGNAMFPVMYAVGADSVSYGLFLDHTYAQHWDFASDPWIVRTSGDALRGYVMQGPDVLDLRADYLELVGHPPVPPRKAFGLWISEYGFDHWHELQDRLATLRARGFPVDGFVLDLQWFGGIITDSDLTPMGSLTWDEKKFPDPDSMIAHLRADHGVGVILIEESYIGRALDEHAILEGRGYLAKQGENGRATYLDANPWWGKGGMIDWTNEEGAAFWHDWKRQPLVELGVVGHWTDLGEPELYDSTSWYDGVVPGEHAHADIHNVYNLAWTASIVDGYRRNGTIRRPFILSRSGTSGTQRYGAALWSGDIGANLASLATHLNAQMHMALSGVDYFGSDIGGFHRGALDGDLDELYTQWFANGALLDVPVRVHTENLCNCKQTAPDRIGHAASNRANIRLRYALAPYYYSLAHRAYRYAEPVIAPLVVHYQDDAQARTIGHEKLIGRDLLVASVARHGETERDVYLPSGTWFDWYTNERHVSNGEWLQAVPVYRDSLLRLPLYARAGAIIPMMHVDEQTMNVLGRRTDGSTRNELKVRVYADTRPGSFVLYEDDGESVAYQDGAVALTSLTQEPGANAVVVTIGATEGTFADAPSERATMVELVAGAVAVSAVVLNGEALPQVGSLAELERAGRGWVAGGDGLVTAMSAKLPVAVAKRFEFRSSGTPE